MVKDLISRPPELAVTIPTVVRIVGQILQDAGVMDSETFKEFVKAVRRIAPNYLDQTFVYDQDASRWQQFAKEMAALYPQLESCYDYWPLQVYYDIWTRNHHKRRRRSRSSTRPSSSKGVKKTQYIGKPPPKHRPPPRDPSFSGSLTRTEEVKDQDTNSKSLLPPPNPNEPLGYPTLTIYPEKCLACCRYPKLTAAHTMVLHHFLASYGMFKILPVLNSFGIFHDGHLKQLYRLTMMERTVLLAELGPDMDVQTLLEHLDKYAMDGESTLIYSSSSPFNIPSSMLCERHAESGDYFHRAIAKRLHSLLNVKLLDFLAPVAVIYGIIDDAQLERTLASTHRASARKFLADHASVTPFHQQLLQIVLRELACHT